MLNHPTHEQLIQLRLFGMAKTLAEQNQMSDAQQMPFEERLAMMVDREMTERENRLTSNRLRRARLKQPAVAED
ncbi:MAG: AAA family ATPase, partial [Gammaproteobacteria bacterium]|nr:AAA family ATPase [Gammaproteobacteria bacterium]NDG88686.1 AAA family ATPase [Gammaproteobacteria bacterium]